MRSLPSSLNFCDMFVCLCKLWVCLCVFRYQGEERGVQAYHRPSSSSSLHGFLGAAELDRPLESVWRTVCQLSNIHVFNRSVRSVWTRPLDDSTQLGEPTWPPAHTKTTLNVGSVVPRLMHLPLCSSLHPNRSVQLPPQPAAGLLLHQHPVQTGGNMQALLLLMAEDTLSRALVTV